MPESPWRWNPSSKRYHHSETGQFLGHEQLIQLRDKFLDARKARARELAAELAAGDRTLLQWERAMREEIRTVYTAQAMLGRGGRKQMTPADWGSVGQSVRQQYTYLRSFAEEVAGGTLSEAQIGARSALYVESGTQAYERARVRAHGLPLTLAQHPGDGQTQCGANCRCALEIEETDEVFNVRWVLSGSGETCDDCRLLAGTWNPLVIGRT